MGSHNKSAQFLRQPPSGLVAEPRYKGTRLYGVLPLGTVHSDPFIFALDLAEGKRPEMYFDLDHDGNLQEEKPLLNEGSEVFAATIRIPFAHVTKTVTVHDIRQSKCRTALSHRDPQKMRPLVRRLG